MTSIIEKVAIGWLDGQMLYSLNVTVNIKVKPTSPASSLQILTNSQQLSEIYLQKSG